MRSRYEHVDQENAIKNAYASTVRSRLGYTTDAFSGVSAYLELENITSVGSQIYNSGEKALPDTIIAVAYIGNVVRIIATRARMSSELKR